MPLPDRYQQILTIQDNRFGASEEGGAYNDRESGLKPEQINLGKQTGEHHEESTIRDRVPTLSFHRGGRNASAAGTAEAKGPRG